MQPRPACEGAGIEIRRYREKQDENFLEKDIFVFVGMYERSKLLLAVVLGPLVLGAWTGGPFALPCYGAWMNDGYRGVPSNAMGH